MERLTYKLGEQNPSYGLVDEASAKPGLFTDYDGFYAHLLANHKLGKYEDTGKTPKEVQAWADAEKDGRLIVLPCKVGDTVYMIFERNCSQCWEIHKYIDEAKVTGFWISEKWLQLQLSNGSTFTCWDGQNLYFGKTVFLTRESAEKALKEREKNG